MAALRHIVPVPRRNLHHHLSWFLNHGLTSQARIELQISSHVEAVRFFVIHLAKQFFALFHEDVARGAGAVTAAGVLQMQAKVQRYVQNRFRLAMVLIGKLAMFKLEAAVLR